MSRLLPLLTFFLLTSLASAISRQARDAFFKSCPTSSCGSGFTIRFPLRIRSANTNPNCSLPGLELTCSGNDTFLYLPSSPLLKVTTIDYNSSQMTLQIGSGYGNLSTSCPLRNLSSFDSLLPTVSNYLSTIPVSLVSCPQSQGAPDSKGVGGPISCLSGPGSVVYAVGAEESMYAIPKGCVVVQNGGEVPFSMDFDDDDDYYGYGYGNDYRSKKNLGEIVDDFDRRREVYLNWRHFNQSTCSRCEARGEFCGYDSESQQSFCQSSGHHGLLVKLITGTSIGGFFVLGTVSLIFFYITRLSKKEKEMRIRVEKFLATYKNTKPTRYTYSGIRKITKRFKHKLGQGGFGSVYKGELLSGIPVAVKMLEKSKGEGQEFINEVATMGRIHHVNVVRLMGFCSEGTRHALVYEYMPNKSLEKFIFSKEAKKTDQPFSMEKLLEIAIGIARGIEYLHQGCDHRILHFDIKPHNILLDHNFNPKISDFGLAKLCSRDQSIVTMTAARGTMGYIAPEIYSRNFGTVSYKSDVYSFGMLLLEMVSGRRNVDPAIENKGEVYFPEWVYNRLVHGQDLGLAHEKGTDADVVKKLLIVALWCIQWSPTDRPTMTRVVQLLLGNLESLQIPPKPFFSSSDQVDRISVNVV